MRYDWYLLMLPHQNGGPAARSIYGETNVRHLITVCKTPHARHDPEDVVICRVDADTRPGVQTGLACESQLKSGVIDTTHVAGAARLMLLRLQPEGVDVDARRWDVGVVLVGLYQVEVTAFAFGEAVVAVKLELGGGDRIVSRIEERE